MKFWERKHEISIFKQEISKIKILIFNLITRAINNKNKISTQLNYKISRVKYEIARENAQLK